jgi:hypothetical protein
MSNIWSSWPESQYEKFLNVPHKTDLALKDMDFFEENLDPEHPYWQPDNRIKYFHESAFYAKGTRTLQEVILHLAIFDFLYNPPSQPEEGKDVIDGTLIKQSHWLIYLFSPVVINLLLLLLVFFLFAVVAQPGNLNGDLAILLQFPYVFSLPIFIWLVVSMRYINDIKVKLSRMHREILDEYYDGYLDLVPQPVLNIWKNMPDANHIKAGILEMNKMQQVIQAGALLAFLGLLEIFSSTMDSPETDKHSMKVQTVIVCDNGQTMNKFSGTDCVTEVGEKIND